MKLSLIRLACVSILLAAGCGADQQQEEAAGAGVEELSADGPAFVEPDDPYDDPSAPTIDAVEEAKSDEVLEAEAEADLATTDAFDKDVDEASDDPALAFEQKVSLAARTKAPRCKKSIRVVFSVGTGAGSTRSNGCWSVIDADGAANKSFRKCSTSSFKVTNGRAPNYAYDDTNFNHGSADISFMRSCSSGASGDGYEYMAYRGGWRLIGAPHLRAIFAELYFTDQDVSSIWHQKGVYRHDRRLRRHRHVYPMINIGPHDAHRIAVDALAMCKSVRNHGYFGIYNGDWMHGMGADDARLKALERALNRCTRR